MPSTPAGLSTSGVLVPTTAPTEATPSVALDARRVVELVRELAEARREVRMLQAERSARAGHTSVGEEAGPLREPTPAPASVDAASSPALSSVATLPSGPPQAVGPTPEGGGSAALLATSASPPLLCQGRTPPSSPDPVHDTDASPVNGARCHPRAGHSRRRQGGGRDRLHRRREQGWQQRYAALRLRYERQRLRHAQELLEVQRLVDAIELEHEWARLRLQQQQQQQQQQRALAEGQGEGSGRRQLPCADESSEVGLQGARERLPRSPRESPARAKALTPVQSPTASPPVPPSTPPRQPPSPAPTRVRIPESLEVTAVSRLSDGEGRQGGGEGAETEADPDPSHATPRVTAAGVPEAAADMVPCLQRELAMWREQCLQLLIAQRSQPLPVVAHTRGTIDAVSLSGGGGAPVTGAGVRETRAEETVAAGTAPVTTAVGALPLTPHEAHPPHPPQQHQETQTPWSYQPPPPLLPQPLTHPPGLFSAPPRPGPAVSYVAGEPVWDGGVPYATAAPAPAVDRCWGPSGTALPPEWYAAAGCPVPPALHSMRDPLTYLPSTDGLLLSYAARARRQCGWGATPASTPSPAGTAAGVGAARWAGGVSSSCGGRVPEGLRIGRGDHRSAVAGADRAPPPLSTPPSSSVDTTTVTTATATTVASTTAPTAVLPCASAGLRARSGTREELERNIKRHDQLLAAITKLQYTAAERAARAPVPDAY